jgi:diadenosine tetraphosphate (Ap4A) HIT family hydrolase
LNENRIFENENLFIEIEESEIPWLKVFTQVPYKEFSHCPESLKLELLEVIDIIENTMISYYQPEKINIASLGNYMPHVHFHVMARFKEDSYFPESMWGKKQREASLDLPSLEGFLIRLKGKMFIYTTK